MKKGGSLMAVVFSVVSLISDAAFAAESYYEGKTIRTIVGSTAGGAYDLYARLISRHIGKHILGKPSGMVENMTGAGGLIAANYMSKVAKPDGLTIGLLNGGLFWNQALGQPGVEFDARKFIFLGAPTKEEGVFYFTKRSGITNMEKLMASKTPVKMGGLAPGINTDNSIRMAKAALGLPIQLVSGYKGGADIRLAMQQGEIAGSSASWMAVRSVWSKVLVSGDGVVVLQVVPKPLPDLPKVPLAISYAKTDEARKLIEVGIYAASIFSWPFVLPPDTPKEQVQVLAKAFTDTLKDEELLAEAEQAKLDIKPISASDLEKTVASIFKLDNTMLSKLTDIFFK
ncbi:MAG: hypothetical protein A3G40_13645 [Deltaproteobacteria bacterium RIFCSPLOWO2_12_FULL_57_22]|nr:MAG: hypothetical protein A3G40_13645 [Deltaproteobacteria bacterium RIFCSPLOWO2_12_FULL_57_22]